MRIVCKDIILRDFKESDIEKRIYWETVETEWQLWDAPWEYDGLSEQARQEELDSYISTMGKWVESYNNMPEDRIRYSVQIETKDGRYIGWCNSYDIDENCEYTTQDGYCTLGINIPDLSARGKGYSYQAWSAFIKYLRSHGINDIFTQTWSGNHRVIHIAEKIGFEEYCRKPSIRFVRGERYDGLTFRLNWEKFNAFSLK